MKVLILKGLPASGKSTWAKEYCKKNTDWIRVNRDDLRNMRGEYNLPKQEKLISKWERLIISETLKSQKNVVIDSTNLNPKHLKSLKEYISLEFENIRFETKNFNTSLEECIRRDLKRVNSVGESVIRDMHSRFLDEITDYEIKQDSSLEKCIIVDIDGTLAKMKNRTPFEWHKVKNDLPKQPIIELVTLYTSNSKEE
jgi:predicted kinase